MALEGAKEHFQEMLPNDETFHTYLDDLQRIRPPEMWIGKSYRAYGNDGISGSTAIEKCWNALSICRNNLFHANKAREVDPPERLEQLLDWCVSLLLKNFQRINMILGKGLVE